MEDIPHILIVDDDAALLQALPQTLYLRMHDITVDTCDSALNALQLIEEHDYDAIVSDIKMPGMDGLVLLGKIRELRPDTPTLLITGHGEYDIAIQALRGGAYDYILKPIDRNVFVAALQRAIQVRQLRRQVVEQHIALAQHAKALEWQVQKRTSELVEANATKDKLLSIVAHELRSPLTGLKGMTQLLQRQVESGTTGGVVRQGLEDMERSLDRTEILIQDLLDTSLMVLNMFVLHREPRNLVALCHRWLDEYTAGVGPSFSCEFSGEPMEVEIDENRLCQVLLNLLSNAHKYAPKGSPVTITLQHAGYEAILAVQDMGIGISAEDLPHIFEQFYRAPDVKVLNGARSGMGLGLYISRKIVERHGGSIEAQSVPGQGSTFFVRLPLAVDLTYADMDAKALVPHTHALWTISH